MIHFKIYKSVTDLPDTWDALPTNDLFLKTPFLKALEHSCPKNISTNYIGIFKDNSLVGIAIIQRVKLYLDDVFRNPTDNALKRLTKALIASVVKGNALIVGNLMHTGQHGLYYNSKMISQTLFLDTIFKVIDALSIQIKKEDNKRVRMICFKDYFETDNIHQNQHLFTKNKLYKLQVQPNMVLDIIPSWSSSQDYVLALSKKYRSRYKSALKKATNVIKKELDLNEINTASKDIYSFYKNVSDNAKVNSFVLDKRHFFYLKKELDQDFRLFGYYLNDQLIGFYTLILNNNQLETYFLGYNPDFQSKYQLYLNMLYDMLDFAITNGFKKVVYARTAMEIKSSVGAKPNAMSIYIKHTDNFILNPTLKYIVNTLNPASKWEERHPFK
ncbi:GNAT family N-acetyltransferase [Olleya marilimosa]|uniref:GNAT family N-acetyltransferase n=1 Tax=Olleya marilimosa TaxID=272164 RepID=A0ABR8LSC0_9FLAO|nr:GNAT family N-acetyltransferase [Olleya marilimosa]MBD3863104.1 GNAT family N-acetyltransferase [Olleya marilimosa]